MASERSADRVSESAVGTGRQTEQGRRISYERRILLLAAAAALPGVVVSLLLLWTGDFTPKVQWTLSLFVVGIAWGLLYSLHERVVFPLQTLANLLEALREGDYSLRARWAGNEGALGDVLKEVNHLGAILRRQRLGAVDATALLRKVMEEIEVAVFTFDGEDRLQLVNRAAERLVALPADRLLGRSASELGLADCLHGPSSGTLQRSFPGGVGRYGVRRSQFRQDGLPHRLLVLTDLSKALREEERQAWQRLIRVLGHELNNSLTPIRSMASTLRGLVAREPPPEDWQEDLERGLVIIADRAESLSRFMAAYSRLARLPPPSAGRVDVRSWVSRVAQLERRLEVRVRSGPELEIRADGDQLEQLLINLVRNAADAALETGGGVEVGWERHDSRLEVWVEDEGPGLPSSANLFVPFFTTKKGGSGIGLALCQQIAEAHGGSIELVDRRLATAGGGEDQERRGCRAVLRLPLEPERAGSDAVVSRSGDTPVSV